MRSLLRSLFLVTAMVLGGGTFAQLQYWATVYGQVSGCYPGQVITVTSSYQTVTATVDPNCYYWASVYTAQNPDTIITSTPCQGAIQMVMSNVTFNGVLDSALVNINFNCGGGGYDCLGILNGPNVPGTACSDNDPMTVNDVWSPSCVCSGTPVLPTCQAAFSIAQTAPYTMQATNLSTGTAPIVFNWWLNGTTSTVSNPTYTFSGPGTYGVCLTITTADACTSVTCDTLYVDSAGTITYSPSYYDCLGALNGPSVPGTPCQIPGTILQGYWSPNCTCDSSSVIVYDCYGWANGPNLPGTACADTINGVPYTGVWSASCLCLTNGLTDCLGIVNGPNMPGTPCNDGDTLTVQDMWTPNCGCSGVIANWYDCLGIFNGFNLPGTPCDDQDPATINDTWDANCGCGGGVFVPCEANFWVLQGVTVDSLNNPTPIPYELWIWNLSSGGSGTYSTFWSFGDGTSSTAQFPTHTYAGNGPYWLCLTIDDGAGCQSTYCDSVSIDGNGLYTGVLGGGSDRQNGFTINIQAPQTTGLTEQSVADGIATWPNPVADELNIALTNALSGTADVTVLDLNGRVVMADRRMLANGRNQLLLQTNTLAPGLYTVRIGNADHSVSQRFVKVN